MKPLSKKNFFLLIVMMCFGMAPSLHAAKTNDDRYESPVATKPDSPSALARVGSDFLTYPLELLRWPTSKGLVFSDKHYLLDKGAWLYEKSVDLGVTPKFDGADFDFLRLGRMKQQLPDAILQGWTRFWPDQYFTAGGKAGYEHIAGTPIRSVMTANYIRRPQENFYGIGPDTSKGNGHTYKLEQTGFEGAVGYNPDPTITADVFGGYKNSHISRGSDDGKARIRPSFDDQGLPGLSGDEIFSTGIRLSKDNRNYKENSTKGYLARLALAYNEGLDDSNARYLKYQAEGIKYFRLGSDRRVFAARFYGEHSGETNGRDVPFYEKAKLGGYGTATAQSQTLRGYDTNRFSDNSLALLNLEYRYTVYEYRDWKLDTVVFFDEGQVFNHFGKFQLGDFRESYGGGFRLSLLNNTRLSIEIGHGDEGTDLYVKSHSPF